MGFAVTVLIGVIIAIGLFALEFAWGSWRSGRAFRHVMPREYRRREPGESLWGQQFGGDLTKTADAVLTFVCDAFLFNPEHRYQLRPDDRILDLYRSIYPRWAPVGDAGEIETLVEELSKEFGFDVTRWHQEMTIAEIVDICGTAERANRNRPIAEPRPGAE